MGQVSREVERGSSVVVERRGEEAFALVPMRLYHLLEQERRALIESTDRARKPFSELSERDRGSGLEAGGGAGPAQDNEPARMEPG
jgi:hypothetical protein